MGKSGKNGQQTEFHFPTAAEEGEKENEKTTHHPSSLLNRRMQPQHLLDNRVQVRQARRELFPCRIGGSAELGELVSESLLFVWAAAEFYQGPL